MHCRLFFKCVASAWVAACLAYTPLNVEGASSHMAKEEVGTLKNHGQEAAWEEGTPRKKQPQIEAVCLLSERNSGSSWLGRLLQENFELEAVDCPWKHDFGMESPSNFLALPPSVLLIANFRNVLDWAPSMHRSPWGAISHCHLAWEAFLQAEWTPGALRDQIPRDAYYEGPESFQISLERYKIELPDSFCNKFETQDIRHPVLYERQDGRYAHNILELRAWKAKRAIEILQLRRQSLLVKHEDLVANVEGWLSMLRKRYRLKAKAAFPVQVSTYKGGHGPHYVHHSELALLRDGNDSSAYWNAATLKVVLDNLDWELESILGYQYCLEDHHQGPCGASMPFGPALKLHAGPSQRFFREQPCHRSAAETSQAKR